MNITFADKHVIVVGASGGIGRATVLAFASSGAHVSALDLSPQAVEEYASTYQGPGSISWASIDILDEASVKRAIDDAKAKHAGRIDVLAHVAGGVVGVVGEAVESTTLENFHRVLDVNVRGLFLVAREVVPAMKAAGRGAIAVVTSGAGLGPTKTGVQAYAAAKHGQIGLVKQLAAELAPFSINVNSVAPGFMPTGPDPQAQWDRWSAEQRETYLSRLVGKRLGRAEDIANALVFLASDQASWITGQTLPVTGAPL